MIRIGPHIRDAENLKNSSERVRVAKKSSGRVGSGSGYSSKPDGQPDRKISGFFFDAPPKRYDN